MTNLHSLFHDEDAKMEAEYNKLIVKYGARQVFAALAITRYMSSLTSDSNTAKHDAVLRYEATDGLLELMGEPLGRASAAGSKTENEPDASTVLGFDAESAATRIGEVVVDTLSEIATGLLRRRTK